MIEIELSWFALLYIGTGLSIVLGLWLYYDGRERPEITAQRNRRTFACLKCDTLYSRVGDPETAACPQCGFENGRLKF